MNVASLTTRGDQTCTLIVLVNITYTGRRFDVRD
jgi:hypothetical protein